MAAPPSSVRTGRCGRRMWSTARHGGACSGAGTLAATVHSAPILHACWLKHKHHLKRESVVCQGGTHWTHWAHVLEAVTEALEELEKPP